LLRVSIPTGFFLCFFCIACFILKFCHISKVKIWIATDRSVSPHLAKWEKNELDVVLNESLNTINKGNRNKVSSVGIIVFHVIINNLQRGITFL
jgi:hypothetical protein